MTMNQDLAAYEAHSRLLEVAKSVDPKVAKIQARRDVEVARAGNENYQVVRGFKWFFVLVAIIAVSMAGCTAYVDGPLNQEVSIIEKQNDKANMETCIQAKGEYSADTNYCDLNP